ncbi:MAG: IS1182 family transposase [Bacteroidota bacterium]
MLGKKELSPQLFYQAFDLNTLVPPGSFYRELKSSVDLSFVRPLVRDLEIYGNCGQKSIDPEVFFKLQLVGYLENLTSDRKLIELSTQHLGIRYFLNYDLNEPLPYHSTISRTRHLYPEAIFRRVFEQILVQCVESGLVAGHSQLIDSSLISANASLNSLQRRKPLFEVTDYLDEVKQSNEGCRVEQVEQSKDADRSDPPAADLRFTHKKNPAKGGSPKGRRPRVNNKDYTSPVDPDARIAMKPSAPSNMYYHSQLAVDSSYHVITHIEADHADHMDSQALPGLINRMRTTLDRCGLRLEAIAADSNYSSGANYAWCEGRGIEAYIPLSSAFKDPPAGFSYDPEKDVFICPNAKLLHYCGMGGDKKDLRIYASNASECKGCPLASQCLNYQRKERRRILMQEDFAAVKRAGDRYLSSRGREMMRWRKSRVEPAFGTLKTYMGMRRIRSRGLLGATKEMIMAATAYNLLKYLRKKTGKGLSGPQNWLRSTWMRIEQSLLHSANKNLFPVN